MNSSQSESERAEPSVRSGVHFFAVSDGVGQARQVTLGVSIPVARAGRSIGVALFCLVSLIPSLLWVVRDRRVWPWDQAWYGEVSVDLWYLFRHSPGEWYQMMVGAIGMKPPGITWLGQFFVPLRNQFGSVESALLFSVLLTQLALLAVIYRISLDLAPELPLIGFLAVSAAAGTEAFVGLSHQYLVEPLQCLAVAWIVLIALRCHAWPRARTSIHLAASLLLGMLAKASTPAYCVIPLAVVLFNLVLSRQPWALGAESRRRDSRALLCGLILFGAFGALWYRRNYAAVLQHVRDSTGEVGLHYGFHAPALAKSILWLRFYGQAFLEPYLIWTMGLLLLAAGSTVLRARIPFPTWRRQWLAAVFSLAQVALILLTFALNDVVEPRYLYALLPYVVVLVVVLAKAARYKAIVILALMACVAQWVVVNRASFELKPVLTNQFNWLSPIVTDPTKRSELADVIQRTSVFPGYDIIAVEEPWLNSNSAAFFAATNRLTTGVRSYYTSLGYAQTDSSAAMNRIEEFSARFVITLDEPFQSTPNFLNVVTLAALNQLKNGGRFAQVRFPSQNGILILNGETWFQRSCALDRIG